MAVSTTSNLGLLNFLFFLFMGEGGKSSMSLLKINSNFHKTKGDQDFWCLSRQQRQSSALRYRLLWGKFQVWLRWQTGWDENCKPLPIRCPRKICSKSKNCTVILNRGIRKSWLYLDHQPQKAPRSKVLYWDLFICITACFLLLFFVISWPSHFW